MKNVHTYFEFSDLFYWTKTFGAYVIFIIMCCLPFQLFGQDMTGEWNGMLKQETGGVAQIYYFSMNLKHQGKNITGTSKISLTTNPQLYAVMELRGTFQHDILQFEETKIKTQAPNSNIKWCIKKGRLKFTIKKDGFCVDGTWGGKTEQGVCPPGTLTICKIVPIAKM